MEKKSYKSWTISDAFWEAVKDEIPQRQRVECKIYKRKPGGGRKPLSKRRVLLEDTLDHIVVLRPEADEEHPQNLCLDAGYTGSDEKVQSHGYTPHIRPCGEEKKELEHNPDFRVRRWAVEVTHSFFNRLNFWSVMKRKPTIIWLLFSLLALLLSGANLSPALL